MTKRQNLLALACMSDFGRQLTDWSPTNAHNTYGCN